MLTSRVEYGALRIEELPRDSIDADSKGSTTERVFKVWTDKRSLIDTSAAFSRFNSWVKENCKRNQYGVQCSSINFVSDDNSPGNVWTVTVTWAPKEKDREKEALRQLPTSWQETFSTLGGKARVKFSNATCRFNVDPDIAAPDFGRGIGPQNGQFTGVEIDAPNFTFNLSNRMSYDSIDTATKTELAERSGRTVNLDTFCGFDPGTVRYVGCEANTVYEYEGETGFIDGEEVEIPTWYWDIRHSFLCAPHGYVQVNSTQVYKRAWDYFETIEIPYDDENTGLTISRTVGAYTHEVYLYTNFSWFGF